MDQYYTEEEKKKDQENYPWLKFELSDKKCECGGQLEKSNQYYYTLPPIFLYRCIKCNKLKEIREN